MGLLPSIMAIAKAVPIIDQWIQQLVVEYTKMRIDAMKKADRDSIQAALKLQDQRDIEKALGSIKTGEISGIQGTVVVNHLPGVK